MCQHCTCRHANIAISYFGACTKHDLSAKVLNGINLDLGSRGNKLTGKGINIDASSLFINACQNKPHAIHTIYKVHFTSKRVSVLYLVVRILRLCGSAVSKNNTANHRGNARQNIA